MIPVGFFWQEELEVFNQKQIDVITAKFNGMTYQQIQNRYQFKSDQQIERFLLRTLLGNKIQGVNDGRVPNLGDVPYKIFIKKAEEGADMNNCIKTRQAVFLLEEILVEYLFHTYQIAHSIRCPIIAEKINNRLHEIELTSS